MRQSDQDGIARALEEQLTRLNGPLVTGDYLRIALGYPSMQAFRQALSRKTVPIPVFAIPQRRGKFALVNDLARWLATQRLASTKDEVK